MADRINWIRQWRQQTGYGAPNSSKVWQSRDKCERYIPCLLNTSKLIIQLDAYYLLDSASARIDIRDVIMMCRKQRRRWLRLSTSSEKPRKMRKWLHECCLSLTSTCYTCTSRPLTSGCRQVIQAAKSSDYDRCPPQTLNRGNH